MNTPIFFSSFISILLFGRSLLLAQQIEYIRLPASPDSSFYDIIRLSDDNYWLAGENGALYRMDAEGKMKNIPYPGNGKDLLKMDTLSDGTVVLIGEEGNLYFYKKQTGTWRHEKVPGYGRKVFYEMAVGTDDELFICGGNSKIAASKARMPHGFIIRSSDGGRHWERIFHHPFAMVWDVDFVDGQLHAVIYNPFNRKRVVVLDEKGKWKSVKKSRYLFHQLEERSRMLAGGTVFGRNNSGAIESISGVEHFHERSQFIWSVRKRGNELTALSREGVIHRWKGRAHETIKTKGGNLYELAEAPDGGYFIVGSSGIVLHLVANEIQAKESN